MPNQAHDQLNRFAGRRLQHDNALSVCLDPDQAVTGWFHWTKIPLTGGGSFAACSERYPSPAGTEMTEISYSAREAPGRSG
jgi:hypothetical protein